MIVSMTRRCAPGITLRIVIAHMQNMQQVLRSDMQSIRNDLKSAEGRLSGRISMLEDKVD